jgi:flagellar basal body-associated protein FliL
MIPWILIAILVLIVLLGIIAIVSIKRKGKQKQNYYSLFIMGAIWVPFGLFIMTLFPDTTIGSIFFILGWIYFVIGTMHKDKWDKKRGPYLIENPTLRWIVILVLGLMVLVGFVAYLFFRGGV